MATLARTQVKGIGSTLFLWVLLPLTLASCTKRTSQSYTQVDRVGRPFRNEIFLYNPTQQNLFNSLAPSSDLLNVSSTVQTEINSVLTVIRSYATGVGLSSAPTVVAVLNGYTPDVLRIDTTLTTTAVGSWAYNKSTPMPSGESLLLGGRKIEDDVWDITAAYLFAGSFTGGPTTAVSNGADRVCYEGASSSRCSLASDRLQGHSLLYSATSYNAAASFPFLATPN